MYLQDIRIESFPVGHGRVQMNYSGTQYYMKQLQSIGTAKVSDTPQESIDIINRSKVPSHTEMVEKLAPNGNPDLIVLSYWMPDLDTSVGNALVTTICAMCNVDVQETLALSENGPGVIFSALEYAQKALERGDYDEVWLFYLNQFQGGSADDERIFWHEPGKGVWLKLTREPRQSSTKMHIERAGASITHKGHIDLSDAWDEIATKLNELQTLGQGDIWQHTHHNEYSQLVTSLSAEKY